MDTSRDSTVAAARQKPRPINHRSLRSPSAGLASYLHSVPRAVSLPSIPITSLYIPELPEPTLPAVHLQFRAPGMFRHITEPATSTRDTASIDGGEPATPGWTRTTRRRRRRLSWLDSNGNGDYEEGGPVAVGRSGPEVERQRGSVGRPSLLLYVALIATQVSPACSCSELI
jgi:hypothetical protein